MIPIEDCANPFGRSTAMSPYTLFIEEEAVSNGSSTVYIDGTEFHNVSFTGETPSTMVAFGQFLHTDQGLEYIPLQRGEPAFGDYEDFAETYFTDDAIRMLHLSILQSSTPDEYFYDTDGNEIFGIDGISIRSQYYTFLDAFDDEWSNWQLSMVPGTYTYVWVENTIYVTQLPWWRRIQELLVPTVYATFDIPQAVYTQTVTVVRDSKEPVGASSILFLPGIMGSHLFEASDICFGLSEKRRWFSHTDCEQERLFLNENGESIFDIYTKSSEVGIVGDVSIAGFQVESIYTSFMEHMNALEGDTIADFVAFPYDWRLRLDQLLLLQENENGEVRYVQGTSYRDGLLYTTLKQMVDESYSGTVTIVAHSNGGLLAKAFLEKLAEEHDPLEDKIDNLILIGSPQVGTPDAVAGVLHGTEIAGGWVVRQEIARQILNDAPMGYHLLPNEYFIDGDGVSVETPVIVFDEGTTTADFRARYGEMIDSSTELTEFLGSASGRVKPAVDDLYTPEVGNDTLLAYADAIGDTLAQWTPPATLHVYELAGIGMWTPKTLRYYSGEQCSKHNLFDFGCDEYESQLEYQVYFTREGDGTVVVPSALAMSESENVERLWFNLQKYNQNNFSDFVHKNMFEIPDVSTFISNIASHATNTETEYISDTEPALQGEPTLVYHLHSPLDMYLTSSVGTISSTTNTIPGAMYRRSGEVQYIIVPEGLEDVVLHLVGYKTGSFTLNVEEWTNDTVTSLREYTAIPSGTSTVVTLRAIDTLLQIDVDGDGAVDGTVDAGEDVIRTITNTTSTDATETESDETLDNFHGTRVFQRQPEGRVEGASTMSEEARLTEVIKLLQQVVNLLVRLKQYENN